MNSSTRRRPPRFSVRQAHREDGWRVELQPDRGGDRARVRRRGDRRRRRAETEVEPLTNYVVARVRRDLGQRAGFGVIATAVNRELRDPALAKPVGRSGVSWRRRRAPVLRAGPRVGGHERAVGQLRVRVGSRPAASPAQLRALLPAARRRQPLVRSVGDVALGLEPPGGLQPERRRTSARTPQYGP